MKVISAFALGVIAALLVTSFAQHQPARKPQPIRGKRSPEPMVKPLACEDWNPYEFVAQNTLKTLKAIGNGERNPADLCAAMNKINEENYGSK